MFARNRNVVNNQHGDHECVEVPNEGNAQKEVPKFPILEGKSSQPFGTVSVGLGKFPTSSKVPWNVVTSGTSFLKAGSGSRAT